MKILFVIMIAILSTNLFASGSGPTLSGPIVTESICDPGSDDSYKSYNFHKVTIEDLKMIQKVFWQEIGKFGECFVKTSRHIYFRRSATTSGTEVSVLTAKKKYKTFTLRLGKLISKKILENGKQFRYESVGTDNFGVYNDVKEKTVVILTMDNNKLVKFEKQLLRGKELDKPQPRESFSCSL